MFLKKSFIILITSLAAYYFLNTLIKTFYTDLLALPFLLFIIIIAYKYPVIYLIIATIIYEKLFQMYPLWIPMWQFNDYALLFVVFGLIVQIVKNRFNLKLGENNYYFNYILLILGIVLFSIAVGSFIIFEQPAETLIFRPRLYFMYLIFLYLCLADFSTKQVFMYIYFIVVSSFIIALLIIIDSKFFGGFKIFQYAWFNGISGERAGTIRIVVYGFASVYTYFYLLSSLRFIKNSRLRFLLFLAWTAITYQIIFCSMTRQQLIMIAMATIIFLLRIQNLFYKTLIYCTLSISILSTVLYFANNMDSFKETSYYKLFETSSSEVAGDTEGSMSLRINGIKFFYKFFEKSYFLGIGMSTAREESSPEYQGLQEHFLFTDLGFFTTLYKFGIFSVVLITIILVRIFRDLAYIQKKGDTQIKIIANSLTYFFISSIMFLPAYRGFFWDGECMYYGIFFYIIYKLKSSLDHQAPVNAENKLTTENSLIQAGI